MENFYEILGLSSSATDTQIKNAFRKKIKKLHPDINQSYDRIAFENVTEAYEFLKDNENRKKLDSYLDNLKNRTNIENSIRNNIKNRNKKFEDEYVKKQSSSTSYKVKAEKIKIELEIPLTVDKMLRGTSIPQKIEDFQVNIKIPSKTYAGEKYYFYPEINGKSYEIIATIKYEKNKEKFLEPKSGDVYMDLNINSNMAALGGEKKITTPLGEKVKIKLKEGVRKNQKIRLKGVGAYREDGNRGDLYIEVSIKKVIFSIKSVFE